MREYVYMGDMVIGVLTNNAYVMDNTSTGTTVVGTWATVNNSQSNPTGYGTNYRTHAAGTGANSFTWTPTVPVAGSYRVYARWVAGTDRATNATYQVTHSSGTTPVVVDQQQRDGEWVLLGTFNAAPGQGHNVRLTDNANGLVVADAVKFIPANANTVYAVHTDHLNTPRAVLNQSQVAVWKWEPADPFGNNPPNQDPDGDTITFEFPLRLPGQYFDTETNLHYNYYRDYDPSIGRYVESDPIGLDAGINTYAYVENNPLGFADPLGLWAWGDPLDPDLINAITGFGDAFLLPELFRNAFDISGGLNQCSAAYRYGKVAGFLTGSAPFALRGAAALGGTRLGNWAFNSNRYFRIGPGRWPSGAGLPPAPNVPRISIGPFGKFNPHRDLRSRLPYVPPIGGPSCDCQQ